MLRVQQVNRNGIFTCAFKKALLRRFVTSLTQWLRRDRFWLFWAHLRLVLSPPTASSSQISSGNLLWVKDRPQRSRKIFWNYPLLPFFFPYRGFDVVSLEDLRNRWTQKIPKMEYLTHLVSLKHCCLIHCLLGIFWEIMVGKIRYLLVHQNNYWVNFTYSNNLSTWELFTNYGFELSRYKLVSYNKQHSQIIF